jgi:hypothetical protein
MYIQSDYEKRAPYLESLDNFYSGSNQNAMKTNFGLIIIGRWPNHDLVQISKSSS